MSELLRDINFGQGRVAHVDSEFDLSPSSGASGEQSGLLREDLLQVGFDQLGLILDAGFYGSWPTGEFRVLVVEDFNWDTPIFSRRTQDIGEFARAIHEAIFMIGAF